MAISARLRGAYLQIHNWSHTSFLARYSRYKYKFCSTLVYISNDQTNKRKLLFPTTPYPPCHLMMISSVLIKRRRSMVSTILLDTRLLIPRTLLVRHSLWMRCMLRISRWMPIRLRLHSNALILTNRISLASLSISQHSQTLTSAPVAHAFCLGGEFLFFAAKGMLKIPLMMSRIFRAWKIALIPRKPPW